MGDDVDPDRYEAEVKRAAARAAPRGEDRGGARDARGRAQKAARLAEIDWDHPALRVFTGQAREGLESVRTWRYMLLKPGAEGGRRARAGPLRRRRAGAGRGPARPRAGDALRLHPRPGVVRLDHPHELPARHAAHRRLAGRRARRAALGARRGGRAPAARGARRVLRSRRWWGRTAGSGASAAALRARTGRRSSSTPDRPGLWQVKVRDLATGGERLDPALAFAVWPDPRESDTRRLEPSELTAWFGGEAHARVAADGKPPESRQVPLWSWLLLLAVAAFLAEGLLVA